MSGQQQLLFGVIADDDSGASDEAGMLHEAGARTILSIGIPSADVELASATDPEFDRNLRGVMAVQWWLASR